MKLNVRRGDGGTIMCYPNSCESLCVCKELLKSPSFLPISVVDGVTKTWRINNCKQKVNSTLAQEHPCLLDLGV